MPTPAAALREDRVIELVIDDIVRSGRSVALIDRPDRKAECNDCLTVDAELLIDGQRWAMDLTTLCWHSELEDAVQKLTSRLTREFGSRLEAMGRMLCVTCHIGTDEAVTGPLIDLARAAITSGQNQRRGAEAATLWPCAPALGTVVVQPWLSRSPNVLEEIVISTGEPIGKTLRRQLSYARAFGYWTCLAIDQRGSPDLTFGAHFLPLPGTIILAVQQVEATEGDSFDAAVVVREDDAVVWIRPSA